MSEPIVVSDDVRVPERALTVRAVRASGPGGQNVNKVATKIDLRVDLDAIEGLSEDHPLARVARGLPYEPDEFERASRTLRMSNALFRCYSSARFEIGEAQRWLGSAPPGPVAAWKSTEWIIAESMSFLRRTSSVSPTRTRSIGPGTVRLKVQY